MPLLLHGSTGGEEGKESEEKEQLRSSEVDRAPSYLEIFLLPSRSWPLLYGFALPIPLPKSLIANVD